MITYPIANHLSTDNHSESHALPFTEHEHKHREIYMNVIFNPLFRLHLRARYGNIMAVQVLVTTDNETNQRTYVYLPSRFVCCNGYIGQCETYFLCTYLPYEIVVVWYSVNKCNIYNILVVIYLNQF